MHMRVQVKAEPRQGSDCARETPATWWLVGFFIVINHVLALYTIIFYRPPGQVYLATLLTCWCTGIGITAGYHRLWSHRAYSAHLILRAGLAILGTNAFQGSIKWWVVRHRLHHRFADTEHDPHDSTRGFFYSHMGWMFQKPFYPRLKAIDVGDLNADPVVRFQHRHIVSLLVLCGYVYPALAGAYVGDWLAGILWIGCVGRVCVWHATWSINSFAHWMGERAYSDTISARGNLVCALLTFGEGYHNFHHEFPRDYRNGARWFDYDPTKWAICLWSWAGLATDLHRADEGAVLQSRVLVAENQVAKLRATLNWGPKDEQLPEMTLGDVQERCRREKLHWIVLGNFAVDVRKFSVQHPGGEQLLKLFHGKDATAAFEGGYNNHSQAARNVAAMYRVARIKRNVNADCMT